MQADDVDPRAMSWVVSKVPLGRLSLASPEWEVGYDLGGET
nr:hypothetical protein [Streptomyces antibioticus]